ncbi:MAG: T9SS type A sorting domain-containing protein [Bacteroidetes bacterium]|nr:T9SS type A sorting domain-containing protein [Bacteroidota bacterium]
MKKLYFSFSLIVFAMISGNAQLSLTKAANEPVVGDLYKKQGYDSTTAVPKNTGAGMTWNFTSLAMNNNTETSTYTTVASIPNSTYYPGATIAEDMGNGNYTLYKSTTSTYEVQGFSQPGFAMNFSNTAVFANWPISLGYNSTDVAGGSATTGSITSAISVTANISGTGTGTIILPGNTILSNILQVITTLTITQSQGTNSAVSIQKEYTYYHSTQKFPLISVQYQIQTSGNITTSSFQIYVNKNVIAGLKENGLDKELGVYPNPAKDLLNIQMNNNSGKNVSATLTNLLGQVVRAENMGSESVINSTLSLQNLDKGIYVLTLKDETSTVTKKIIIE